MFLGGLFSVFSAMDGVEHPTDSEMITNFQANKGMFLELVKMIEEDQILERVDDNWTRPEEPIPGVHSGRIAEYRKKFQQLKIPRGFYAAVNPTVIDFIANSRGLGISGSSKGYSYRNEKPDSVVDNLDNFRAENRRFFKAFRHIEGPWYLFYEYED